MLEHGGRLRRAAEHYGIPPVDWLDLSTGLNPNGWPVPAIPAECWQRLPEDDDELADAARRYYGNPRILAVAGSQAAIQALPSLRSPGRVGVLHPAYAEHAANWQRAGHQLVVLAEAAIEPALADLDVLIVVNPNNPTGKLWQPDQLLAWQIRLAERGGWLVVDEAFMDSRPESSLAGLPVRPGLIVLRSLGKFFGLAGVRCGFVIAEADLLARLAEMLGPWPISHPGRYVATRALTDTVWQNAAIRQLQSQATRLAALLHEHGWPPSGGCDLFQWLHCPAAPALHAALAEHGILTRLFSDPASLRFGLPGDSNAWRRLSLVLARPEIQALKRYSGAGAEANSYSSPSLAK